MRSRKCCGCGWEWRDCRRRAIAIAAHCGYLGMLTDGEDGRRRKVYALIFTAV
ncbi:hypothetical protein [Mycobacterium riyadhense]|uniref:hypothetical protein n=1 Tax=Mycobacterium riyadhense TaxID=486698 RepID=UPI003F49978C